MSTIQHPAAGELRKALEGLLELMGWQAELVRGTLARLDDPDAKGITAKPAKRKRKRW